MGHGFAVFNKNTTKVCVLGAKRQIWGTRSQTILREWIVVSLLYWDFRGTNYSLKYQALVLEYIRKQRWHGGKPFLSQSHFQFWELLRPQNLASWCNQPLPISYPWLSGCLLAYCVLAGLCIRILFETWLCVSGDSQTTPTHRFNPLKYHKNLNS